MPLLNIETLWKNSTKLAQVRDWINHISKDLKRIPYGTHGKFNFDKLSKLSYDL